MTPKTHVPIYHQDIIQLVKDRTYIFKEGYIH